MLQFGSGTHRLVALVATFVPQSVLVQPQIDSMPTQEVRLEVLTHIQGAGVGMLGNKKGVNEQFHGPKMLD